MTDPGTKLVEILEREEVPPLDSREIVLPAQTTGIGGERLEEQRLRRQPPGKPRTDTADVEKQPPESRSGKKPVVVPRTARRRQDRCQPRKRHIGIGRHGDLPKELRRHRPERLTGPRVKLPRSGERAAAGELAEIPYRLRSVTDPRGPEDCLHRLLVRPPVQKAEYPLPLLPRRHAQNPVVHGPHPRKASLQLLAQLLPRSETHSARQRP